jgi:hypothetical protein
VSIGGVAWAAHTNTSTPPRNTAGFFELAENSAFLDRKPTGTLNETVDGHQLKGKGPFMDRHK